MLPTSAVAKKYKTETTKLMNGWTNNSPLKDIAFKAIYTNHAQPSSSESINVFQGKIQTVQFTNIYKHILFLHDILMITVTRKTN